MTEEIEAHVLKKYEILQKLGKSSDSMALKTRESASSFTLSKSEIGLVLSNISFIWEAKSFVCWSWDKSRASLIPD